MSDTELKLEEETNDVDSTTTANEGAASDQESNGHDDVQEPDYSEALRDIDGDPKDHNRKGYEMRKAATPAAESKKESIDEDALADKVAQRLLMAEVPNIINESLMGLTKNPDKAKLIKHYYETRIQKTGYSRESILRDLKSATAIIDSEFAPKRDEQLKRATTSNNAAEQNASTQSSTTKVSDVETNDSHPAYKYFSQDQLANLAKRGVDPKKVYANIKKNE